MSSVTFEFIISPPSAAIIAPAVGGGKTDQQRPGRGVREGGSKREGVNKMGKPKIVKVFDGPEDCTRRELALIAFHESGMNDDKLFSEFWCKYQELLVQKLGHEAHYLTEMLNEQGKERACKAREQRSQDLKSVVLFAVSFFCGSVVTLFLRL